MDRIRLIIDGPERGSWNMAVDEALLQTAKQTGHTTFRLYRWKEPTLSLGYFQRAGARDTHLPSRHCPLVRRSTGGGAILHDRELTYTLAAPMAALTDRSVHHWYRIVHTTLVTALAMWDVETHLCSETDPSRERAFLCFQRRAQGDVLFHGAKVAGSAQRRCRGALMQHGSLLLDRSEAAPELPGIRQLTANRLETPCFLAYWLRCLARRLGIQWRHASLDASERELARALEQERFGRPKWTLRR